MTAVSPTSIHANSHVSAAKRPPTPDQTSAGEVCAGVITITIMAAAPRKWKNEENKERTPPAKRTEAVKRM